MRSTYATLTELNTLFIQGAEYDVDSQTLAQSMSFDIINSFINSSINIPPTGDIGVLKLIQSQLYQYILQKINLGDSEENQRLYDYAVEQLKKLTQNELTIPGYQFSSENAGYHIVEQSSAAGILHIIPNQLPNYPAKYKIVFTTGGSVRSGNARYSVYRDDDIATAVQTGIVPKFEQRTLLYGYTGTLAFLDSPTVIFNGTFALNDYFWIECVPSFNIDVPAPTVSRTLKQGGIVY